MIPIIKGKAPRSYVEELGRLRQTPDASVKWDEVRDRAAVLDQLIREQGGLCAYCMCRINSNSAHVEHIVPQSQCSQGQDVDYRNMLAVCDGNEKSGDPCAFTCDRARGDVALRVNPLKPDTLLKIYYQQNGLICSSDDEVQRDLDRTLNLNCRAAYLPQRRKEVIDTLNRKLYEVASHRNVASFCRKKYEELKNASVKEPFTGVLLYFLKKRARRN